MYYCISRADVDTLKGPIHLYALLVRVPLPPLSYSNQRRLQGWTEDRHAPSCHEAACVQSSHNPGHRSSAEVDLYERHEHFQQKDRRHSRQAIAGSNTGTFYQIFDTIVLTSPHRMLSRLCCLDLVSTSTLCIFPISFTNSKSATGKQSTLIYFVSSTPMEATQFRHSTKGIVSLDHF